MDEVSAFIVQGARVWVCYHNVALQAATVMLLKDVNNLK